MIRSMTGFGRGEVLENNRKFTVEMKSVNHRYFDVNIRMPKNLSFFDSAIRSKLKEHLKRGKIDVFINYEAYTEGNVLLRYNESLAAEYVNYYKKISETFGLENDIRASVIARSPDVFSLDEQPDNEEEMWSSLKKALDQACEQMVAERVREGDALKNDLIGKLDQMLENVSLVEERYPQIVAEYTQRVRDKIHELLEDAQIDESRLAAELVIFSDKICTDEETVRLRSHIESMKDALIKGGEIGRKLDFIAQEMNREANTILSKANDLETSNIAIDLKTGIEKVREQIQNIE